MKARSLLPLILILPLSASFAPAAEIHEAARQGDLDRLRSLLTENVQLAVAADDRDCRPIHFAAEGGQLEAMALLAANGAGLSVLDVDGDTPLHRAAMAGHLEAVRWLADRNVALDSQNFHLDTPLLHAVRELHYEVVDELIDRGADIELANDYGRNPLLWCTREGGDLRMARLLLERGADVNAVDIFGDTPLSLASWRGFRTLVNVLLDHGATVDASGDMGRQLLAESTARGLDRLYAGLVTGGIEIDTGCGPRGSWLHRAAGGGSASIVADLLDRGSDPDAVDPYGWTPLHHAAARRRPEAVAVLLQRGADLDRRTISGWSALNLAEARGCPRSTSLLRENGADPAPRNLDLGDAPYFGQESPGRNPTLFAPDVVADPYGQHGNVTFSPDGREAFWSAHTDIPDSGYVYGTIYHSQVEDGRWTAPRMASFATERQGDDVPCFAPDGRRLYFMSRRPVTGERQDRKENIWYVERDGDGWGEPVPLPPAVNLFHHHWQFSVSAAGHLYFSGRDGGSASKGIWRSERTGDTWLEPEFLGFSGLTPFVAPDESYLITLELASGGRWNMIRYRRVDGTWGEPINLSRLAGRGIGGLCPQVTPDGRYFLYLSHGAGENNSWWVEADFIEGSRPREQGQSVRLRE